MMISRVAVSGRLLDQALAIRSGFERVRSPKSPIKLSLLPEWRMRFQLLDMLVHRRRFFIEEFTDRVRKPWVRDPMRRPRRRGQHAARHLVHALRAAFEPGKPVLDAILNSLHIAGFKLQSRDQFFRAPSPPEHDSAP